MAEYIYLYYLRDELVYVGRTKDIARRVREHSSNNEKNLYLYNYEKYCDIYYIKVPGLTESEALETILISQCQPRFNTQKKNIKTIDEKAYIDILKMNSTLYREKLKELEGLEWLEELKDLEEELEEEPEEPEEELEELEELEEPKELEKLKRELEELKEKLKELEESQKNTLKEQEKLEQQLEGLEQLEELEEQEKLEQQLKGLEQLEELEEQEKLEQQLEELKELEELEEQLDNIESSNSNKNTFKQIFSKIKQKLEPEEHQKNTYRKILLFILTALSPIALIITSWVGDNLSTLCFILLVIFLIKIFKQNKFFIGLEFIYLMGVFADSDRWILAFGFIYSLFIKYFIKNKKLQFLFYFTIFIIVFGTLE